MRSPKISVVVPIYKAEKFLHCCVDSILSQTFEDFELLLVDDGSPDGSGEICDAYAKADGRVHVYHIPNSGANRAREYGVRKAHDSEYITFVDSDDSLPPTALQELYALTSGEYDIVVGNYDRNDKQYVDGEIDKLAFVKRIFHYEIAPSPYAKLFRRELFDYTTFDLPRDFVMGEDFIMNLRLAFACQRMIRVAPSVVYHYNDNAEGIVNTFDYTLEYLTKSYRFKKNAIPEEYRDECMSHCIANVLKANYVIVGYYYHRKTKVKPQIHKEVVADMHQYNYTSQWWERFSLKFSNPTYSRFYLWVRSMIILLKNIKKNLS